MNPAPAGGRADPAPREPAWALHEALTSPAAQDQHRARLAAGRTNSSRKQATR
ncbi:hypothetical protein [Amycolatopsis sp. FDAARGOS 1241]|uniref:hypothetical protein n=1 Tax=Amycolatopsis sp. FDAARGOS 1241 TaxID=2778070 RepID=UPI00194EA3FF|nr:hypothetical protein [Amycolatopsis sp. FDAARGOS 1241]QRP46045.1 hypothetical protein I6J71_44535 [Amycolatopsis sp. FDAARGOS 1241]